MTDRAAVIGLALSFIPADRQGAFRERLAELTSASPDYAGVGEDVRAALELAEGDLTATDYREPRYPLVRLERAALLQALAAEHVAERLDTVIALAFDEGRAIHTRAS